jgi:hypothetical protein
MYILNKYCVEWEKLQNVKNHLANVKNNKIWMDIFPFVEDILNMSSPTIIPCMVYSL